MSFQIVIRYSYALREIQPRKKSTKNFSQSSKAVSKRQTKNSIKKVFPQCPKWWICSGNGFGLRIFFEAICQKGTENGRKAKIEKCRNLRYLVEFLGKIVQDFLAMTLPHVRCRFAENCQKYFGLRPAIAIALQFLQTFGRTTVLWAPLKVS